MNLMRISRALIAGYLLNNAAFVEAQTAACDETRCVGADTSGSTPVVDDTCGTACDNDSACEDFDCIRDQVLSDDVCPDGSVCLRAQYHQLLTLALTDPCDCTISEGLSNTVSFTSEVTTDLTGFCFSSMATVDVQNKGTTFVRELEVGDLVLTGRNGYQSVYTIDHKAPNKIAKFVQITSTANPESPLELTEGHMVYVHGKENPIPASAVNLGDALQTGVGSQPSNVTDISSIERKGVWNPITVDGSILVDGIMTSSYSVLFRNNDEATVKLGGVNVISHHDFLHLLMTPYRAICLRISLSFCETKQEFNSYSWLGTRISKLFHGQNEVVQDTIIIVGLQIAYAFKLFSLVSRPFVTTGIVLGTGTYYCLKKLQRK